MSNEIRDFFDERAEAWDDHADDDLAFVRTLFEKVGIKKGDRVLDLACGTGVVTGLLHELSGAPVLGIDIAPKMIEVAKRKYEGKDYASFLAMDFLDYEGEPFDAIVIYNAYPHFVDVDALVHKLSACLKEGGRAAIIHSAGRKALEKHHHGLSHSISRNLLPVKEEIIPFLKEFDPVAYDEGEDRYYFVLAKK